MEKTRDPRSGFCEETETYKSKMPHVEVPDLDVISFVLSRRSHHPVETALIDAFTGQSLTNASMLQSVHNMAQGLCNLGVKKGDVIMVISPNSTSLPIIYLSIMSTGSILTTANPYLTPRELNFHVKSSNPCLAFAPSHLIPHLRPLGIPAILIDAPDFPKELENGCVSTVQMLMACSSSKIHRKVEINPEDIGAILYSSGTTGKSKGVMCTHKNLVSMIAMIAKMREREPKVAMCSVPIFHVFGLAYSLACLVCSSPLILLPRFDLGLMSKAVETYRVEVLPVSPPILSAMIKYPDLAQYDLSSLKLLLSGGAPLSKKLGQQFTAKFPHIHCIQGLGMTEGGPVAYPTEYEGNINKGCGLLVSTLEAKIVDMETGKPMPPNHKGELWLKGSSVMKGYLGDESATLAAIDPQGWLKTGDLCYFDENGILFVVDRIKELIKYKGYQVAPGELEELLLLHPEILDAVVIPYPDEEAGEIPMAFVIKKVGSRISYKEVMDYIAKQVSPYKKIRRVAFVDSIPKSPSGKVLRKKLSEQALQNSKM